MRSKARASWLPALGATLLVSLVGCTGYQAPQIRVGEAVLGEVAAEAVRVELEIELENPNDEPLELLRFDYTFSIDGRAVFVGRRAAQATLARSAVRSISIPAVVRYDQVTWGDALPTEAQWSVSGGVVYVTPDALGEILLDARLIEPTASFAGGGVVAMTAP